MNREESDLNQDNDNDLNQDNNDNEDKLKQIVNYPSAVAGLSEDIEKKQINALIQNNDELIKTYKDQLNKQAEFAFQAEENRHQEVMMREKNTLEIEIKKTEIQKHSQNTIRIVIGCIFGIIVGGYIFAGFTKDSSFPKDIINLIMGGLGGAGGLTLIQKQNKDNPPKQ